VISGNLDTGIISGGPETANLVIRGNYIGTDASGTRALPNGTGINLNNRPNHILITGNVISGNDASGVLVADRVFSSSITANFIGVDVTGTKALGNGGAGVYLVEGASGNTIGGTGLGAGNMIAYNGGAGVVIATATSTNNSILGNAIFANAAIGIDLGDDDVTANDLNDADSGPNELLNFPVISSAAIFGSTLFIQGDLGSPPGTNYHRVQFFSSPSADASGYGEGKLYLGSQLVTRTGTNAGASFAAVLTAPNEPAHWITATATDPFGNTSEFGLAVLAQAGNQPQISQQPTNVTASPGGSITLCVAATSSPPPAYQWRQNGVNILGATNQCLSLTGVTAKDGGTYDVVVYSPLGAVLSGAATVVITLPTLASGDNLANRVPLVSASNTIRASNLNATREAGKPGGASLWYSFTSPVTGIMSIDTVGSSIDTLLAVYTGTTFPALAEVASADEGAPGLASKVEFNVQSNLTYVIAVDGYGAAMGNFVLSWNFQATSLFYPVIVLQPVSKTVAPGVNHTFVTSVTGTGLTYQWYLNGSPIPGATNNSRTVTNVQANSVGTYVLRVTQGIRTLESHPASLQINFTGGSPQDVQVEDKFLDASVLTSPIQLGTSGSPLAPEKPANAPLARGYTGTQIFNTYGTVSAVGEGPICGVPGGASSWIRLLAAESGDLYVNTDGSSFDTVTALYERIPGVAALHQLGCDNNSGLDRIDSSLVVPVVAGRTNFIQVDGVNAATGVLMLNYDLVVPATLSVAGRNDSGQQRLQITGRPGMSFTVQSTSNFATWTTLYSGTEPTGSYLFTDPSLPPASSRFYRLLMRP
jgi:hypothetical protein